MTVRIQFQSLDHVSSTLDSRRADIPVGSGGKTNTSGSDRDGEDFTDNNPSSWSPSGSEEEDVDTDQRNLTLNSGGVFTVGDTNDSADELADEHTN